LLVAGRQVALAIDECLANSYGATVRWHRVDLLPFDYHGVVRFDWAEISTRFVPIEIGPRQLEWTAGQPPDGDVGHVVIPLGAPCGPSDEIREWRELALEGRSSAGCVSGPWLRGTQERWCTQKLAVAKQLYRVHDMGWLRANTNWVVAVAPTEVVIQHDGKRFRFTDPASVEQIEHQLSTLWTIAPLEQEHCRDGGETTIELLSNEGWRSVTRNCADPAGVLEMLKSLEPGQGLTAEPDVPTSRLPARNCWTVTSESLSDAHTSAPPQPPRLECAL
jgi:hypothetical protein